MADKFGGLMGEYEKAFGRFLACLLCMPDDYDDDDEEELEEEFENGIFIEHIGRIGSDYVDTLESLYFENKS